MKKIFLSLAVAIGLTLGLASCSGDLHDMELADTTILKEACIVGINDNWDKDGKSDNRLTKVDDTFYTYTFTSKKAAQQFSIVEVSGSWASRWCGNNTKGAAEDSATVAIKPGEDFKDMVYSTEKDPTNVQISGLSINSKYKITLKIVDAGKKTLACKIELTEAGEAPTEYSWEGLTLKGGWEGWWSDTKTLTADAEQTLTITAVDADAEHPVSKNEFGIFGGSGNVWEVKDLAFGTRTEMIFKDGAGDNSTLAVDWEASATYTIKLELTDKSIDAPKAYITITKK